MLTWLNQWLQDLRYGIRTFARTPGFTTLAVLSLALGIMATTAMYSVIHAVVLDPFPYKDVDRADERPRLGPGRARRPPRLQHRSVPRDRRTEHDLRRDDRVHDLRHPVDRRGRPAAPARQLRHAEHVPRHGRAAAPRTALPPRRRPAGRGAGRRARLPVLAAAVRRRHRRGWPATPPQRQGPHRRRGDAEAVHVARRRRLPAGHPRARDLRRGDQERAPARAVEAGRDRRAGRGGSESDHLGSREEGADAVPADVACRAAVLQGDLSKQHPRRSVGPLRRRRPAAPDRVRERVESPAVEGSRPSARNGRPGRARRQAGCACCVSC